MKNFIWKKTLVLTIFAVVALLGFSGCKHDSDSGNSHAPKITAMYFAASKDDMNNKVYISSAAKGSTIYVRFYVTDEGMDEKICYTKYTCGTMIENSQGKMNQTIENRTTTNMSWSGTRKLPDFAGNWTITIQIEDEAGNKSNEFSKVITLY